MKFGAFPLRANGDTAPIGVQLSLPGPESPKCRGTNSILVLAIMVLLRPINEQRHTDLAHRG